MTSNPPAPNQGTSTPSANHFFAKALVDLDVDRKARDAGVVDQPPPHSMAIDSNEREFIGYFSNQVRGRKSACEKALSQYALDRTATSSKIDIAQTRASLARIFNSIEPDLARLRHDCQQELEQAKDEEARALRYLRYFQIEHQLQNREPDPAPSQIMHFAVVAVFAVLEWVALSIFYAEGSDFGLLGGVLMAMALSIINIVLAVFAGAVLRYLNHRRVFRKSLGVLGAAILISVFVFATGFAAHYRNAVREIAVSQSQPTPQSIEQSSARRLLQPRQTAQSDDDQWKASKLAYDYFKEHGFAFTDVLSWLLVILALIFGFVAAWKGYGIDDRYPGYGPIFRKYKERSDAYEAAKRNYAQLVDGIFSVAGEKQQGLLRETRKHIEYFQDLAAKSETEARGYSALASAMQQACSDVIFRYRELNRQVATGAAPRYFADAVRLEAELMEGHEALTQMERDRLKEYTDAIREFTNLVQQDDARRQEMRTRYLGGLNQFFAGIERAISEKLAREAQLFAA